MGRLSYIIYIVFFMFYCIQNALSQSADRNYVKSVNLAEAMEWGDIIDRGGIDNINHTTEVVYYDGLGRPVQDISNISGQTKEDGTVKQKVHYYPFGGIFNDTGLNTGLQQYFLKSSTFAVLNDNKISPCESRRALHGYLSHRRRNKGIPTLLRY